MRYSTTDFRTALLMIGAPIPRYHRGRGPDSRSRQQRLDYVMKRISYFDRASEHCQQFNLGDAVEFMVDYEKWFDTHTVCEEE